MTVGPNGLPAGSDPRSFSQQVVDQAHRDRRDELDALQGFADAARAHVRAHPEIVDAVVDVDFERFSRIVLRLPGGDRIPLVLSVARTDPRFDAARPYLLELAAEVDGADLIGTADAFAIIGFVTPRRAPPIARRPTFPASLEVALRTPAGQYGPAAEDHVPATQRRRDDAEQAAREVALRTPAGQYGPAADDLVSAELQRLRDDAEQAALEGAHADASLHIEAGEVAVLDLSLRAADGRQARGRVSVTLDPAPAGSGTPWSLRLAGDLVDGAAHVVLSEVAR